jgi:enoyl-CoA hydratase/carnithine racemase
MGMPMTNYDDPVLYRDEGSIALITINRPQKRNALNAAVAAGLEKAWHAFNSSLASVAVLSASGNRAFCAGADLNDPPARWFCVPNAGIVVSKPIISAVSGWCIGGGLTLMQNTDICIATEGAQFAYPEPRLGVTGGMIAGLVGKIPYKVAMELMLTARPMASSRAYDIGLVNSVVPDGQHLESALELAREMSTYDLGVLTTLKALAHETLLCSPSETASQTRAMLDSIGTNRRLTRDNKRDAPSEPRK